MRPSPVMMATLFLAVCAAFVIVVPAMGDVGPAPPKQAKSAPMSVDTSEAERNAAGETLAAGGCKSVATFTSSAVPALQKDACISCHSGANVSAKSALDLTNVGTNNAAACAQALAKVNLANKSQSVLIQAPAGSHAHMGGKVEDTQAFTTAPGLDEQRIESVRDPIADREAAT